jgi:DNA-binding Xre family transcriptional regulator
MSSTKPARAGLGSSFEDFLKETGDYEAVTRAARKAVLAWQLEEAREKQGLTKAALAERMGTSRSQLNRLLDPDNDDVTLAALERVAAALGREIRLELADDGAAKVARRTRKAPNPARTAKPRMIAKRR